MEEKPYYPRAGFVAVMGRPNVGKSTLINTILGQKIAAVSPRPQTTRHRQMGIFTTMKEDQVSQIVFIDTPGIHKPLNKLGEFMNNEATKTMEECDLILFVADASDFPHDEDLLLIDLINKLSNQREVILALNKIDLVNQDTLNVHTEKFIFKLPQATAKPVSATRRDNLEGLISALLEHLPHGDPFFPTDQLTDLYEREIAADLIRESALINLRDEVPHGIAIRIDQFKERDNQGAYIEATLLVERESHKPIVIGQGGKMLKKIGTSARKEIEAMSGRKVYLDLRVKVRKNWRNDLDVLRRLGYQ